MDSLSISSASLAMNAELSRQVLSTSMVKQAVQQQNQMAALIAQNSTPAVTNSDNRYTFSTYA